MDTKFNKLGVETNPSKFAVETKFRRLGEETKPALDIPVVVDCKEISRKLVDTKFSKLGVETNPSKFAVDTWFNKLGVETKFRRLGEEMKPALPIPVIVD